LAERFDKLNNIYFEPGRFIVEDAAVAVTTVCKIKNCEGIKWLITDIGTNILIPLPAARFEVTDVNGNSGYGEVYSIGDGTCSPAGVIQRDVQLDNITEGDRILVNSCGAYTYSLAETFCNLIPAAYFVKTDGHIATMVSPQTAQDVAELLFYGAINVKEKK
jgi:diaminopimelate decarboxylase